MRHNNTFLKTFLLSHQDSRSKPPRETRRVLAFVKGERDRENLKRREERQSKMTDKALIPRFTGEGEAREWRQYKARVLATATTKGWQKALEENRRIPTKDWLNQHDDKHPDYQELKDIYDENSTAWAFLLKTMDSLAMDELLMHDAEKNAHKAWKDFEAKYEPNSNQDCIRKMAEFERCSLDDFASPEAWILKLETLNLELARMNPTFKKSESLVNSMILSKLPRDYDPIIPHLSQRNDTTGGLTIRELKRQLQAHYETRLKVPSPHNLAMTIDRPNGSFQSRGQGAGHQEQGRYQGNPRRGFQGNCYYCGMWGHRISQCWKLQEDEEAGKVCCYASISGASN